MKLDGFAVGGSEDKKDVRQLVAGLRLLRAYGKVAEYALQRLKEGKSVDMLLPLVERRTGGPKGHYEVSPVALHRAVSVPTLPDYSGLRFRLERGKDDRGKPARHFLIYLVSGEALAVYPCGSVSQIVCDDIVGSVWPTSGGYAWSFNNEGKTKRVQGEVRKSIARRTAEVLVKLKSDGHGQVWHAQAVQVRDKLRARAEAKILLDGHAERLRSLAEAEVAVETVHSR